MLSAMHAGGLELLSLPRVLMQQDFVHHVQCFPVVNSVIEGDVQVLATAARVSMPIQLLSGFLLALFAVWTSNQAADERTWAGSFCAMPVAWLLVCQLLIMSLAYLWVRRSALLMQVSIGRLVKSMCADTSLSLSDVEAPQTFAWIRNTFAALAVTHGRSPQN